MNLSVDEIIKLLGLTPHPTCGFVKQTYLSEVTIPQSSLPNVFTSDRIAGAVMYFMVTQKTKIELHKIHSDQMYHFYCGHPLEVLLCYPKGKVEIKIMGHDLKNGMLPQLFIPGDTFHISKLHAGGEYALLSTTEWPGVLPEDVEVIDFTKLMELFPKYKNIITDFMK